MIDSDGWQAARLIPTSGISGQDEAERRATSALLAVMQAVREFRVAVLKPLGAPAGNLQQTPPRLSTPHHDSGAFSIPKPHHPTGRSCPSYPIGRRA